ncbi:MAG TPA: hypothetical protein PKN52_02120 [Trueperaceae bacterium]|nr:hypothetical protein [Trueperaceae bacterium]
MNDFDTLSGVLASAVATSGTFTTGYPSGGRIGDYRSGKAHKLIVGQKEYSSPNDFGVAYTSATVITITWRAANTLPAGSAFRLQLDRGGGAFVDGRQDRGPPGVNNASYAGVVRVNLGAPITADVDGVAAVQLLGSATDFVLDGARVVDGVAILDVPRNITLTVATTDHSGKTITVYGTDEYGEELIESRAGPNNNTVALAKAFKTVTRVASSAAIATNGISVGFGDGIWRSRPPSSRERALIGKRGICRKRGHWVGSYRGQVLHSARLQVLVHRTAGADVKDGAGDAAWSYR